MTGTLLRCLVEQAGDGQDGGVEVEALGALVDRELAVRVCGIEEQGDAGCYKLVMAAETAVAIALASLMLLEIFVSKDSSRFPKYSSLPS